MKKLAVFPLCVGCISAAVTSHAIDLKQSKLTQVVNDVQIISAADQKQKPASLNDIFAMPDILRTGAASRAELVAQDETVTRVGANTIFSFDPANRTIDLKQGSLLFHSPHGKGGGAIHTGSATASVLGTTLIVVTTPNGGMKVIALEGEVEVKFLNGLKQKLDPGQMTFVLPGANQLAPVVIFRLDELTQNSLLVKGFNQTLSSLPLIDNQVNQQNKLIKSGKISDTGLYAGNTATPNQVEVLDLNTVSGEQHKPQPQTQEAPPPNEPPTPPTPVFNATAAEAADATINQSSLSDVSIPTPPLHLYTGSPLTISGNDFFNGKSFAGFIARNIYFNTPDSGLSALTVNVTSGLNPFDFVAVNDISLEGSVTFKGLNVQKNIALIAGDQILFASGITVRADVNDFLFSAPTDMTFDNVTLANMHKDIELNTFGSLIFQNNSEVDANGRFIANASADISVADSHFFTGSTLLTSLNGSIFFDDSEVDTPTHGHVILIAPVSINLDNSIINSDFVTLSGTANTAINVNNSTINAPSSILFNTTGDINVTGTPVEQPENKAKFVKHEVSSGGTQLNADATYGAVTLNSVSGNVNVSGTSITAHFLTLNSGDGILLDASGQSLIAEGPNSKASFTAPKLIDVKNADLTSYASVNMAANTINLMNVAFSGTVSLKSLLGIWHNGFLPGAVNDLGGNTYDGQIISAPDGTSGLLPGTGITVGSLSGSSISMSSGAVNGIITYGGPNGGNGGSGLFVANGVRAGH